MENRDTPRKPSITVVRSGDPNVDYPKLAEHGQVIEIHSVESLSETLRRIKHGEESDATNFILIIDAHLISHETALVVSDSDSGDDGRMIMGGRGALLRLFAVKGLQVAVEGLHDKGRGVHLIDAREECVAIPEEKFFAGLHEGHRRTYDMPWAKRLRKQNRSGKKRK